MDHAELRGDGINQERVNVFLRRWVAHCLQVRPGKLPAHPGTFEPEAARVSDVVRHGADAAELEIDHTQELVAKRLLSPDDVARVEIKMRGDDSFPGVGLRLRKGADPVAEAFRVKITEELFPPR